MAEYSPSSRSRQQEGVFPFDCIVVTSPDAASADSAKAPLSRILERRLQQQYPCQTIRVVSTYDSYGARCGSGGGTLAALEFASPGDTVLILHAGGDSSRCPTQMILGKAWTSLPSRRYPNPTIWLLDQIQHLYDEAQFPRGTVVVAATDTIVSFFEDDIEEKIAWNYEYTNESVVLGVAVPADVSTAKNHGVYVLSQEIANSTTLGIEDPFDVWQKPSVDQLLNITDPAPACFTQDAAKDRKLAWIDTGVIVFLPKAVQVLYELSNGILARCTRKGLKDAYDQAQREGQNLDQCVEQFASTKALKIDLYTDILHNLSWPSQQTKPNTPLRRVLSRLVLQTLVAPQGRFLHLGTTKELKDFVTSGAYSSLSEDVPSTVSHETTATLSAHFLLKPRHQCWTDPQPLLHNVALQSTFPLGGNCSVGKLAHIEYCDLADYNAVTIGSNSMLSGWRNPITKGSSFHIPSDVVVQQVSLQQTTGAKLYAFIVLGIRDGIKTERTYATLFGLPLCDFFQRTGITPVDLGWVDGPDKADTLWTALLHPMVPEGTSFESVYSWLHKLLTSEQENVDKDPSLLKWISLPRVALKQLHSRADAEQEWSFRQKLEHRVCELQQDCFIPHLKALLIERCHNIPCDLDWIFDMEDRNAADAKLADILLALEDLIQAEFEKKHYDICGRSFMIASALLADYNEATGEAHKQEGADAIERFCFPRIMQLRTSSSSRSMSCDENLSVLIEISDHRKSTMTASLQNTLTAYSNVMERLSFCMNELSVASGYHDFLDPSGSSYILSQQSESTMTNTWVTAMAPVRVDLAGGWSDTPPLCYEFGGSVTGMAILVDDYMPLSCRCRITPGQTGILLRTESRSSEDGSLKSFSDADISDIMGLSTFRDPLSDCALIKAALICLGMVTEVEICSNAELQPLINRFSSLKENVRLEIVTSSLLPQGSGMGTSSILAACVLESIAKCVGMGDLDDDFVLHAVLMLEQLLTSGGGWQDQAHGVIPGVKTVRSAPSKLPLQISVEKLEIEPVFHSRLEKRLYLVFTGKTRLAKNILQNVLRRWARRTNEVVALVSRNVALSEQCKEALTDGDIDELGRIVLEYSRIKIQMAGKDSGVMPEACHFLISDLLRSDSIKGASLCGAGGGGFMVLITSEGVERHALECRIQELAVQCPDLSSFKLSTCRISHCGLVTQAQPEDQSSTVDGFNLASQKY